MDKVVLKYKRDTKNKHVMIGSVTYIPENGAEDEVSFDGVDFRAMMTTYAEMLKKYGDARAFYGRLEKPGMPEGELDPLTTDGLRNNTEETVEDLTNPKPVVIDMRGRL
jgi:hypothetical protein